MSDNIIPIYIRIWAALPTSYLKEYLTFNRANKGPGGLALIATLVLTVANWNVNK